MKVTVSTNKGDIHLKLYDDKTPKTVTNFVFLAQKWYYDWLKFHRVIDNFMIQGGCPDGTWAWGPWYTFEDEFHDELTHIGPWVLSMANAWPWTNWSQFFITHTETSWLDGKHSVFGNVISDADQDIVNNIQEWDTIESIVIHDDVEELFEKNAEFLSMIQ